METKEKKLDFSPPGWLVTNFHVRLDDEQAKELDALRRRMTEKLGQQDPRISLRSLMQRAVELLLKDEGTPCTSMLNSSES